MNKMSNPQPFGISRTPECKPERSPMKTVLRRALFSRRKFTVLAVAAALTLGTASAAFAGSGIGGVFNLGKTNTVNAITKLTGSVAGSSLQIINNSTNAAATALDLQVATGKPPLKVNSTTKVANLNADSLDGQDSGAFANSTHTHSGEQIDSGTVEADRIEDGPGSNLDADKLDGLNSTDLTVGMATVSGFGNNPTTTIDFLTQPAQVSVAAGQSVHVTSNKAFGSTAIGGGQDLDLYICSRSTAAPVGTVPTLHGGGVLDNRLSQNQRTTMGLSYVIAGLSQGTYQVGLCGKSSLPGSWNSNEWGYTTAIIVKPSVGTAASLAQQSESPRSSEQN
jgi:hypothetical protein